MPAIAANGRGWIPSGSGGMAALLLAPAIVAAPISGRKRAIDLDRPQYGRSPILVKGVG